jgi:hypothetical protein
VHYFSRRHRTLQQFTSMDDLGLYIVLLVLLGIANGAPIFTKKLLGQKLATPLDLGLILPDGQPLFGRAKTIRGLIVSVICTALAAEPLGLGWRIGAGIAASSMLGDLASSFLKRRLRLPPHAQAFGLDQIPEALLPLLVFKAPLNLSWWEIGVLIGVFIVLEILLSRLLFRLRIRDRPY